MTPPHDSGIYLTPVEMGRPFYISVPTNWTVPLIFTNDPMVYDQIKAAQLTGIQPKVCMLYNDKLYFWPVGLVGDVVTFYTSVFTTDSDDTAGMVEGGDPVLSKHWDTVLRLGAMDELMIGEKSYDVWHKAYTDAYNQEAHNHIQEAGVPLQVDHSSNRLGF